MPRPGPRPFECIRRAWHSDTHQPLRGRLIQEIFRVVNELHSTSTRRKTEWQDKLPRVVFRAEEILYSKANSENEYMDVKTLPMRLDDAVNTMIRREDDDESSGPYLQPCVEAALSIGCTPRKVSRGYMQGSRLCTGGARRTNPTSSPAVTIPASAKCSVVPDLPDPPIGVVMQDTGYCEATSSGFVRENGGFNPVYSEATAPMLTGGGFSFFYTSDGHVNSHASRGFSRGHECPVSHSTFHIPCLPEFVRTSEPGRLYSFPSLPSTTMHHQFLPEPIEEERISQSIPTSGTQTNTAVISSHLQWSCCSPLTANSIASSPSCLPDLWNSDAVAQASDSVDVVATTARCKTVGSQVHFPVEVDFQLHTSCSASDHKTNASGQEETSSPLLCTLATLGYEEPVCSSRRFPLKESLVSATLKRENAALFGETHDLQLRLGPPGEADKVTSSGHRIDDFERISSNTSNTRPYQQYNASSRVKASLNTSEAIPDVYFAARHCELNVVSRAQEALSSNSQVRFAGDSWGQSVECRKNASSFDVSTGKDYKLPASKRMRMEPHHISDYESMLPMDFTSKQFPWS